MFISQSELKNIHDNIDTLNKLGSKTDNNLIKVWDRILAMQDDFKVLLQAQNKTNDKVYDHQLIIDKTNIYKKKDSGHSFFDAELTNDSLLALVKRVENLEQSLKKPTRKKVTKNATIKRKKS